MNEQSKEPNVNIERDVKYLGALMKILIGLVLFFIIQLFYVILS